jgi:hypothetical protein
VAILVYILAILVYILALLVHFGAIWYILVCCTKKNLATLHETSQKQKKKKRSFISRKFRKVSSEFLRVKKKRLESKVLLKVLCTLVSLNVMTLANDFVSWQNLIINLVAHFR